MFVPFVWIIFTFLDVINGQNNTTTLILDNTTTTTATSPVNATVTPPTVHPAETCTKICPADIRIIRWMYQPYTEFFDDLLSILLNDCCGHHYYCYNLTYQADMKRHEDVNDAIGKTLLENETHVGAVYFPVYGTMKKIEYQEKQLYPVVESPGVVYIELTGRRDNSATKVLGKLVGGWPVLMLTIIMAAVSGIIIWAMDSYYNPEELPPTFFKGAWEGFWWAFISMTTVGYGDIAPRSFLGRIFSFFWILIGLTIISIFTATVTSALTELSLIQELSLYGKEMIVWNLTEEHRYGVKGNARVHPVENIGDFGSGVKNLLKRVKELNVNVDGGLIDNYVAGHYKLKLSSSEFFVPKVFDYGYSYGFLTDGAMESQSISSCFRRKVREKEKDIEEMINIRFQKYKNTTDTQSEAGGGFNLFDTNSPVFKYAVISCSGAIFILMLIGAAWEYIFWPKKKTKKFAVRDDKRPRSPYSSYEEMISAHVKELECAMHDQCVSFYRSFHNTIEEVRKNRIYMEGEDDEFDDEEETSASDLSLKESPVTGSHVALVP